MNDPHDGHDLEPQEKYAARMARSAGGPLDLSDMVLKARASAGIASPEHLAAEAKVDHLLAMTRIAECLPDALGHLPTEVLLGWGQVLTNEGQAGTGQFGSLLDVLRAELDTRADVPGAEVANDG